MKKANITKKITALLTAIIMLMLASCSDGTGSSEPATGDEATGPLVTYSETTQNVTKSETVYVNLDYSGNAQKITVSDWLHADRGNVQVSDTTTLKDINITKGQAASVSSGGKLTWHMTDSDVYYEGTTDKQLPVTINIKYFLDEAEIKPEELVGKSGNFRMEITMKNNISKQVDLNGTKVTMFAPIVAMGGMMLPYENFTNIEVSNGITVGGGNYEIVVLTGAPGINESLNLNKLDISGLEGYSFSDTFSISATVADFKLADIYFAMMPVSSLNLDVQMPGTLNDVKNVLTQIQDIQSILTQLDPNSILADFITDADAVREMLDVLQKGLDVYNQNKKMLNVLSQQLTPENIAILSEFLNSLNADDMQALMDVMSNVPALQSLLESMMNLSQGLDAVLPILESFSAALDDPEVAASMQNLPQTLSTLSELMNYLNENQELLDVLTALMATQEIDELANTLNGIESGNISLGDTDFTDLPESTQEIIKRMEEWLRFDYSIYTSAPDYMKTNCTFICKTDPIG